MAIKRLSPDLNGKTFKISGGKKFTVVEGEHYPPRSISKQHHEYLDGLPVGQLVSVAFYGQPVPLVVVNDGVVRLAEITTGRGEAVKGSLAISRALGLEETRSPFALSAE
jgi:hypothetical protein